MTQHESRKISLSDFAPRKWFSAPSESSFWLRIFSLVGASEETLREQSAAMPREVHLDRPVAMHLAHLQGLKLPLSDITIHALPSGITQFSMHARDQALPEGPYVFLATPFRTGDQPGDEVSAKHRLDVVGGVIAAHFGVNLMREMIYQGEVEAEGGRFSFSSPVVRVPQATEGPFLHVQNWNDAMEIVDCIARTEKQRADRLRLAIEFLHRALRDSEPFFFYWTALEVLCNGKAQRIRSRIQGCYRLASVGDVDRQTGFATIARWRHEFFHKGRRVTLSADVERYIQLLFLDLLRQELQLPLRGFLAAIQAASGYNLAPLGLPDNRTEEQKAMEQTKK